MFKLHISTSNWFKKNGNCIHLNLPQFVIYIYIYIYEWNWDIFKVFSLLFIFLLYVRLWALELYAMCIGIVNNGFEL
jgi:hypothetical protein